MLITFPVLKGSWKLLFVRSRKDMVLCKYLNIRLQHKFNVHVGIIQFLLIFINCHQNVGGEKGHENYVPVPPGTSTLAFVFDTTGSMNDDLIQVQNGAKKILDIVLKQRPKFIYNFVYVPFHDPSNSLFLLYIPSYKSF